MWKASLTDYQLDELLVPNVHKDSVPIDPRIEVSVTSEI